MLKKIGEFLYPHKTTIVIFFVLLVITPVLYIYAEPERTNYLPEEEQHWMIKTRVYPNIIKEYFFHTDGDIDTLLGIIERNYYANYIGIPLLAFYYILASGINRFVHRIKWESDLAK